MRYVVISPVRDEEQYIEFTLRSVLSQTNLPHLWVLVDDGSKDRTIDIVRRYEAIHPFIRVITHHGRGERHAGSRVIRLFNEGYECLREQDAEFDFIVKLDCDLSFGPSFFQVLLERMIGDETLGIASGVYLEQNPGGTWVPVRMPAYHAAGACKVLKRRCFEEINGFIALPGWDTVDEIRAWGAGWETRHFADLEARHHRPEGVGIGRLRTSRMHGEIYYRTGGDPWFLLFKVFHRLTARPFLVGGLSLAFGYFQAAVRRQSLLVTAREASGYRRLLRQRLMGRNPSPLSLMPLQLDH